MQDLIVQPEGMVTLALNQKRNATFNCECTAGDACNNPYWVLENEGKIIMTNENNDIESFAQRGITCSSDTTLIFQIKWKTTTPR